jgi:hypothetical protein
MKQLKLRSWVCTTDDVCATNGDLSPCPQSSTTLAHDIETNSNGTERCGCAPDNRRVHKKLPDDLATQNDLSQNVIPSKLNLEDENEEEKFSEL